jgi:Protein of unknown function (DUF3305)
MSNNPTVTTSVLMRRERVPGAMSKWQTWRWVLHDVVLQEPGHGEGARLLRDSDDIQIWLHPGFEVGLHRDDAEGYFLNATSPRPCWFVLWRMEEEARLAAEPVAVPTMVSLSYHDAGRWLDAQESVDQVAAPEPVIAWMSEFAQSHWVAEGKKRQRPESFRGLQDRFGNPASVSTDKTRKS